MKKFSMTLFLVFAITLLSFLGACNNEKSVETPEGKIIIKENKDGVEVRSADGSLSIQGNENTGHIKIKTEDGDDIEVSYNKDKLAKDFPKDIPIYKPSTVQMSQVFKNGRNAMATFSTKDNFDKVLNFYKDALEKNDWALGGEMSIGGMTMIQGKKGDFSLNLSILKGEDGDTSINMAMTENLEDK